MNQQCLNEQNHLQLQSQTLIFENFFLCHPLLDYKNLPAYKQQTTTNIFTNQDKLMKRKSKLEIDFIENLPAKPEIIIFQKKKYQILSKHT